MKTFISTSTAVLLATLAGALGLHPYISAAEEAKLWTLPYQSELTIADCQTLLAGLNALDGHAELTKDGTLVTLPYKFGSGKLRMAIQQNLAALNAVQQDFSTVQQQVYREVAGEAPSIAPGSPELARYNRLIGEALKAPCKAKLEPLKVADLKLDQNEIPGSVLAALSRILER